MDLVKDSPFELALTTWRIRPGQDTLVAVVKGTFAIAPGGPCTVADAQRLCEGDVPWDDAEGASLRTEADLAVYKPQGECFLVGSCHAPGGRASAAAVSFSLGPVRKELAVYGDRTWGELGVASAPAPFAEMPLRWERSFGGAGFAANPVGRGAAGDALPNLEDPRAPLRAPGEAVAPVCTAPVPRAWPARAALAGTYDDVWQGTRFPWFPEDFDWRYFLAAPADQRIGGFWRGDEGFSMAGVRPDGAHVHGRLAGLRPRLFFVVDAPGGRGFQEVVLQLDTVTLDADAMEAVCLWRGLLDVASPRHPELAAAFLAHEPLDANADAAAHLARFEALERQRLADESPAPEPVPPSPMAAPDAPALAPPRDLRAEVETALAAGDSLAGRDLTGADLAGLDLAGLDLAGAVFTDAKLAGASFAGSRLTEALFARADLAGASLARAFVQRADFTDARLDGADLRGANLGDAVFAGASLAGATLAGSIADGADLAGADLTHADLTGASLVRADLTRARLGRARCDGAVLRDASFSDVAAPGASFAGADLTDLRANDGCDLTGALLRGVKAEGSKWHGARLDDADLALSALGRADFTGASLERARLDGCALRNARFVDARMAGASLLKADLMEGSLEGADLTRADLRAASLHGVDLWRATAEGAATELAVLTGTRWERA